MKQIFAVAVAAALAISGSAFAASHGGAKMDDKKDAMAKDGGAKKDAMGKADKKGDDMKKDGMKKDEMKK